MARSRVQSLGGASPITAGAGALERLETSPADLLLLDLSLRSGDGLDALKQLRARRPEQRILVLTTHDEKVTADLCAQQAPKCQGSGVLIASRSAELIALSGPVGPW